jgi:hypothetical protein
MFSQILFSRDSDNWATPKKFYDQLNDEFCFDKFDPCPLNSKFDGLLIPWQKRVFLTLSPPKR